VTATKDRVARSDWVARAGRAGLAARGVLYVAVGLLALQVALGDNEEASREGALHAVARQPLGRMLVVVLAAGMAAFAVWQLVLAVLDPGGEGDDPSGLAKRAANLGRAAVYGAGLATALPLAMGRPTKGGSSTEQDWTAKALHLPMGRWLVGAVGLAVIGAGGWNGWKGMSGRWRKNIDTAQMSKAEKRWAEPIAVAGLVGRMLVFGLVGGFLVRAAVRYDPHKGVGLDAALKEVREKAYGPYALVVFAIALIMFGVFSLLQARWRKLDTTDR
jgi:hypothetical protein